MKPIVDVLKKIREKNEYVCIHSNVNDTSKFIFGKLIGIDGIFFALSMISLDGKADGIVIKEIDDIQYVEQSTSYIEKMSRLLSYWNEKIRTDEIFSPIMDGILQWGLDLAKKRKYVVSLEINHSGIIDITGIIIENENELCVLKQIDENGQEDGVCYVSHEEITQLCMNSSDENRVSILFQTNNIMR